MLQLLNDEETPPIAYEKYVCKKLLAEVVLKENKVGSLLDTSFAFNQNVIL